MPGIPHIISLKGTLWAKILARIATRVQPLSKIGSERSDKRIVSWGSLCVMPGLVFFAFVRMFNAQQIFSLIIIYVMNHKCMGNRQ